MPDFKELVPPASFQIDAMTGRVIRLAGRATGAERQSGC
jgi:hypothetical protein